MTFRDSGKVEWVDGCLHRQGWLTRYTLGGGSFRSLPLSEEIADRLSAIWIAREDVDSARVADQGSQRVIGVMRKILQRGYAPPVHPAVEQELLSSLDIDYSVPLESIGDLTPKLKQVVENLHRSAQSRLGILNHRYDDALPFGSAEERAFVDWVGSQLGQQAVQWLIPQARLDLVLASRGVESQGIILVDFMLQAPWLRPLVIEIDGLQHEEAKVIDAQADRSAEQAGISVLRIPTSEIRDGEGPQLDALKDFWSQPKSSEDVPVLELLPAQVHRTVLGILEGVEAGFLGSDTWSIRLFETSQLVGGVLGPYFDALAAIDDLWGEGYLTPKRIDIRGTNENWSYERRDGHYVSTKWADGVLDLELSVEWETLPTAPLPVPNRNAPRVIIRPAIMPVPLLDARGDGVSQRVRPGRLSETVDRSLEVLLQTIFAKSKFREGQLEAIKEVLVGHDCTVLLPTGAGKSIIYQLAGLCLPGRTIVVSPIVSLIEDQAQGMATHGIDRVACLTSTAMKNQGKDELLMQVSRGDALFMLMAPERLQSKAFRDSLTSLTARIPINFAAIDEAHCVSDWGHDFRTAYLLVGRTLRACCKSNDGSPLPLLALTGTASRAVLKDVLAQLDLGQSVPGVVIKPKNFDRGELQFLLRSTEPSGASAALEGELRSMADRAGIDIAQYFSARGERTASGLVFCTTVGGLNGVAQVSNVVQSAIGSRPLMYTGKAPEGEDSKSWDSTKRQNAFRFKNNASPVMVATNAYGMGIDKPNIRWVVHYGMPGSIEAYYQQVGRAGRDRRDAQCILLLIEYDEKRDRILLGEENSLESMREQVGKIRRAQADDISSQLYFHLSSFSGEKSELMALMSIVDQLQPSDSRQDLEIPWSGDVKSEQALARLVRLGVVRDYWKPTMRKFGVTVEGTSPEQVRETLAAYIERSQAGRSKIILEHLAGIDSLSLREAIEACARELIRFVYDTIERSRRRSLREMWLAARESQIATEELEAGERFRARILDYLSEGEVSPIVERLAGEALFSLSNWKSQLDELRDSVSAQEWRGNTARLLTADPTNTGLLVARALSECLSPDRDLEDVRSNLEGAFESAGSRFGLSSEDLVSLADWLLDWAASRDHEVLAVVEIAIQNANLDGGAIQHSALVTARAYAEPSGAIVVNHWEEATRGLNITLGKLLKKLEERLTNVG
jgi:ATP-dependent DNA helicase RecQ